MAEVLLSRGADTARLYGDGHTIAHMAALRDKAVVMQALAKHGADLSAKVCLCGLGRLRGAGSWGAGFVGLGFVRGGVCGVEVCGVGV